jgi:hypothetical protein
MLSAQRLAHPAPSASAQRPARSSDEIAIALALVVEVASFATCQNQHEHLVA